MNKYSKGIRKTIIWSAIAVIIFGSIFLIRIKSFYANYYYNADQNYSYPFDNSKAVIVEIKTINNKISLPNEVMYYDTGFLEISFKSNLLGYISEPYLIIRNSGVTLKEYYELGAHGRRYVNVSYFLNLKTVDSELSIYTHHMKAAKEPIRFIGFNNPPIGKKKILVIAPHPDDAEIAAFGLYNNRESFILTITSGDSSQYIYQGKEDIKEYYLTKGNLRAWDSNVIPIWGGIQCKNILNLGYFDGTLQRMFKEPKLAASSTYTKLNNTGNYRKFNQTELVPKNGADATWINLVNDLIAVFNSFRPEIIVTPHPILDAHPDHKFSTIAALTALKKSDLKQVDLYLYTNSYVYAEYYPFGKIYSSITLPPWFDANRYLFSTIYSGQLTEKLQRKKIFSLEAMHDLRTISGYAYEKPFKDIITSLKNGARNIVARGPSRYSYFRRAIRNNELFFIVNYEDIGKLEQITNSFLNMKDRSSYYNKLQK